MPDYLRDIQNGTMMIRDTGGNVEFWFKTGSSTYNNEQNWGYSADTIPYQEFEYRLARGGNWQMFGAVGIGTRQNVTFRIVGEGLGWPTTDFTVFIERARQPDPPQIPYLLERYTDRLRVAFDYNYDGGLPIVESRIWYSYDGQPRFIVGGRDAVIGGLAPKTGYSFWGEVRNDRGWSGLGPGTAFATYGVPDQPPIPYVAARSQTAMGIAFSGIPGDGGTPIREFQIAYGTNPDTAQFYVAGTDTEATGLSPGAKYYVWVRARNDIGWSPWSARVEVQLPAGGWVNVNGVWRRAVPWVKTNGAWKIAQPRILLNNVWRSAGS